MDNVWYVIAQSELGTHRISLKNMTFEKACKVGRDYCSEKGLEYINTCDLWVADQVEHALKNGTYDK